MISSVAGFTYIDLIFTFIPVIVICTIASIVAFKLLFAVKAGKKIRKIKKKTETDEGLLVKEQSQEMKDWNIFWKTIGVLFMLLVLAIIIFPFFWLV